MTKKKKTQKKEDSADVAVNHSNEQESNENNSEKNNSASPGTRWGMLIVALILFVVAGIFVGRWSLSLYCKTEARSRISQFEFSRALEILEFAEMWRLDDAETHFLKARIYRKTGKFKEFDDAIAEARKQGLEASRVEGEKLLSLAQSGKISDLLAQLEKLVGGTEQFDPSEVYEAMVNGFLLHSRFDEASNYLENWEKDFPGDPNQRLYKAYLLYRFGGVRNIDNAQLKAAEILDKLTADYPRHYRALLAYGDLLMMLNQVEKAAEQYSKCLDHPDAGIVPRRSLAGCYSDLGKTDEAKRLYEQVLEADPDDVEARGELGKLQFNDEEYQAARKNLEFAYQQRSWDYDIALNLARTLEVLGEKPKAEKLFERAANIQEKLGEIQILISEVDSSRDEDLRVKLGIMLLEYGDPEKGMLYLKSVLDANPNHAGAREAINRHLSNKSRTNSSVNLFDTPIK